MQHFRVKIFAQEPADIDLGEAIPVFHRWIQQGLVSEHLLIDVADYRHVPQGPGVLLVAHEAFFSLDLGKGRVGLLYNRRTTVDGDDRSRLKQALDAALAACRRLESEPAFAGRLRFNTDEVEITVNDRLMAPNTPETFAAMEPDVRGVLDGMWGAGAYSLIQEGEPRELLRLRACTV